MHTARRFAAMFLATLVVFVLLDAAWLWLVGLKMFQNHVGSILRPEPMLGAVIAFYPVYAVGLVVLAVQPAVAARSLAAAALKGALLGLTAYATFDLTNLAVIKGWTIGLASMDIAWGVVGSAIAALAGYAAGSRFSSRPAQSFCEERY